MLGYTQIIKLLSLSISCSPSPMKQDFILITSGSSLGTNYTLTINGLPATATNRPRISSNSGYTLNL